MAQLAHVDVGDSPVDLTAGRAAGCYVVQVASRPAVMGDEAVLYCSAETAPADSDDWFRAGVGAFFAFTVGGDAATTWAKTSAAGLTVPVALAMVP